MKLIRSTLNIATLIWNFAETSLLSRKHTFHITNKFFHRENVKININQLELSQGRYRQGIFRNFRFENHFEGKPAKWKIKGW